ncbi:resistance protein Rx N-terminal domain-containing protein [Streptomyces bicolor]|uniref:resistance protein Rx N-terminal domain-containing protein n=1 Tax=Streptomyces bicolor TaxID=66874 RepID=UPI0004E1F636|nr:resistance protein Rx N-terminal domain-containing protein [Streptomyces bicolor]
MPSVLGLLEAREKKVREEVARLREEAERIQAALGAAERQLERLGQARETVTEVLAGAVAEGPGPVRAAAVMRATVPHRVEGIGAEALTTEYQRILAALATPEADGGMRAKQIALTLGAPTVPARVEGVRSRLKRLAARGWATEVEPGLFTVCKERLPVAA